MCPGFEGHISSVLIANQAGSSIGLGQGYVYGARVSGIDSFGAVILHEMRHRWQLQQSWGITDQDNQQTLESKIGPNGTWIFDGNIYDRDSDGMRDSWERLVWQQPDISKLGPDDARQYAFFKNQEFDGNSFEKDNEFDADMNGARTWAIGSADGQDWANNGKQAN